METQQKSLDALEKRVMQIPRNALPFGKPFVPSGSELFAYLLDSEAIHQI
jgi:hypothetical protein